MFIKGDIVRCINGKYRYTSYMRPCTVKGYDYLGKLIVEPFDDGGSTYDVEDKYFEIVPSTEILAEGQEIRVNGIDNKSAIYFVKYLYKGMVRVEVNGWYEDIDIERVIYKRGFISNVSKLNRARYLHCR